MIDKITDKEALVLDFIIEYHIFNNRPPSYRQIGKGLEIDHSTVFNIVKRLESKGAMGKNLIAKGVRTEHDGQNRKIRDRRSD